MDLSVNPETQARPEAELHAAGQLDSNHDTALSLACSRGHKDVVEQLLSRGTDIEHRDDSGCTPLILAAMTGHEKVVEILINHTADIEAKSSYSKDTPLSLACAKGRYKVVKLLLTQGAYTEHRNALDFTPLALAAAEGYVNIIKLLLTHGAEINSHTGSNLGLSPLILASANGQTDTVKLLLNKGSDINIQTTVNKGTALTLACSQGQYEVVRLLLDWKANIKHRDRLGLTALMEAASGGFVEIGRLLLDKGADVNTPSFPSYRDTALIIAADQGHCQFVELLITRGAKIEVKNRKGNSPLWSAANGGHLEVVELLYQVGADINSEDNCKVSCLMAAFRKGHTKVVDWMINHLTQFPSDQEMTRYISSVRDEKLLQKCRDCMKIIRAAKDLHATRAEINATLLVTELLMEKTREESKQTAAVRRQERKKKKKLQKKEESKTLHEESQKNKMMCGEEEENENKVKEEEMNIAGVVGEQSLGRAMVEGEDGDSANCQGSCSSNKVKTAAKRRRKAKNKKKLGSNTGRGGENSAPINGHPPLETVTAENCKVKKGPVKTFGITSALMSCVPSLQKLSLTPAEKCTAQSAAVRSTTKTTIMTTNRVNKVVTTTATISSQTYAEKLMGKVTPVLSLPSTPQLSPPPVPISAPHPLPAPSASLPSPLLQSVTPTEITTEYSLFNDTFTKSVHQALWGRVIDPSQKGRNFAGVAGTGTSSNEPISPTNKYLENAPPQVDASKSPGYRQVAVCSPVLSPSDNESPSLSQNSPYPALKPLKSLTQSQPLAVAQPEYTRPVYAESPPDHSTALLKIVPQTDSSHHSMSYSQQSATTTVTMSRLNPCAPEFISSMKPPPSQ